MNYIKPNELIPGDVILCKGKDLVSDMISWLDGGEYSHATLYIGDNTICEADFDGVLNVGLSKIRNEEKYGDVYRFKKDGHCFNKTDWSAEPVLAVSSSYVAEGTKYAFDHLLLLAMIVLTRRIPLPKREAIIIRTLIDEGTKIIFDIIDQGKTPMVCSELVYRCFSEAIPLEKYQLDIEYPYPNHPSECGRLEGQTVDLRLEESLNNFLIAWNSSKKSKLSLKASIRPDSASVSPRDLANSSDLELIGRLSFE